MEPELTGWHMMRWPWRHLSYQVYGYETPLRHDMVYCPQDQSGTGWQWDAKYAHVNVQRNAYDQRELLMRKEALEYWIQSQIKLL